MKLMDPQQKNHGSDRTTIFRDYGKFALYSLPCFLAVAFMSIILVPRFEQLLALAKPDGDLPPVVSGMVGIFEFVMVYFYFVVPPLILAFVFAELYFSFWHRIRSPVLAVLQFCMVMATLLALLILATVSLAFLPMLTDGPNDPEMNSHTVE